MKTYSIPIIFDVNDIVYNKDNPHDKIFIYKVDLERGLYLCDGCTIPIIEEFSYKKVESIDDLFIGDFVRIEGNPDCFAIAEFLDNNQVRIHQVHGDNYDLIVKVEDLLGRNGHHLLISKDLNYDY